MLCKQSSTINIAIAVLILFTPTRNTACISSIELQVYLIVITTMIVDECL